MLLEGDLRTAQLPNGDVLPFYLFVWKKGFQESTEIILALNAPADSNVVKSTGAASDVFSNLG